MSVRDVFILAFGGLLALWGVLVWRMAWTGELPRAVRSGGGWRARVRSALAVSSPTGRLMPLLILGIWALYLMYVCLVVAGRLEGGAARLFRTAGLTLLVVFVAISLLAATVHLLKRPRALIPPYARD